MSNTMVHLWYKNYNLAGIAAIVPSWSAPVDS